MSTSFLFRRNGVYYFRRRVPASLRAHVGADEIRKSLRTGDRDVALARAQDEAVRFDAQFARLRVQRRAASGVPPTAFVGEAARPSGPFGALFERWNARAPHPRTTLYDFAKAARRFAALHDDLPIELVSPAHVEMFRDALIAEHLAPGTIRKQMGALAAMLQVAVDEGMLAANPARGLVPRVARTAAARVGFDAAELTAIFSSPVYAHGERPVAGAGDAAFWLPLLALYTGARQGEIGALRVRDVHEQAGVVFLDMQTEHARSDEMPRRTVPLHPDLLKLGFLQFAEMQRRAGQSRLFPALRADNKGKLTGNWSKWFARYLRQDVGIGDARKTFDSFRYTFLDACAEAAVPPPLVDALIGRRVRRRAAAPRHSPAQLAAAVETLRFQLAARHD